MCSPCARRASPGGAAGGRARRAAGAVPDGAPDDAQADPGAGGRRAVPPAAGHRLHLAAQPGERHPEAETQHLRAHRQRVSTTGGRQAAAHTRGEGVAGRGELALTLAIAIFSFLMLEMGAKRCQNSVIVFKNSVIVTQGLESHFLLGSYYFVFNF